MSLVGVGMYPTDPCFDPNRASWLPYWIDNTTESACYYGTDSLLGQMGGVVGGAAGTVASGAASAVASGVATGVSNTSASGLLLVAAVGVAALFLLKR
jgi:hypothetical protein